MFIKNEGIIDRLVRIILAEVFFILAWYWLGGVWQVVLYVLSAVMICTSITGFCALYKLFNLRTNKNEPKKVKKLFFIFGVIFVAVLVAGSYYSNFFTRKLFLEDYNKMNNYYKQTLFNTGQEKRAESIANYDKLVTEYAIFSKKYTNYHPQVIASDINFNSDLEKVSVAISNFKEGVYSGKLKETHTGLEVIRPIFQDILKRNNFSMLAVSLVDFHDSMEKVIEAADKKDSTGVIQAYIDANSKLVEVELVASDDEIKAIRTNLEALLELAKTNNGDALPILAAELKTSFVKVYLKRG